MIETYFWIWLITLMIVLIVIIVLIFRQSVKGSTSSDEVIEGDGLGKLRR